MRFASCHCVSYDSGRDRRAPGLCRVTAWDPDPGGQGRWSGLAPGPPHPCVSGLGCSAKPREAHGRETRNTAKKLRQKIKRHSLQVGLREEAGTESSLTYPRSRREVGPACRGWGALPPLQPGFGQAAAGS